MMTDFVEWKPEFDGQKPPFWQDGMDWGFSSVAPTARTKGAPSWSRFNSYAVPREAVYGPTPTLSDLKQALSKHSTEELAKHGVTLEPEKDWATELWADLWEVRGFPEHANLVRRGQMSRADSKAIELIRSRATPKDAGT